MKNLVRLKQSRTGRPVLLAASAVVLAAAVAGAAGIAAGPGNAAAAVKADKADKPSYPHKKAKFKHPKLKHGELTIVGTNASDKITLRLQAGQPNILQVDVGDDGTPDFSFDRSTVTKIAVNARSGNDVVRIDESNGAFTDTIPTTINGGDGNDTIAGGKGAETLLGGNGNDSIDGNGGNDLALLGAGDDTFIWDPGDGSDTIEGQDGTDTMLFNGANVSEQVNLSANGNRLKFFRTQGNITMDTAGVERVDFNALGGADLVTINDLTGTDVSSVNVDLAGTLGGATGDGQPDRVVVNGTNGEDSIRVNGDAGGVKVSGLAATVKILHPEAANDRLEINTLAGRDSVDSSGLAAGAIPLFVDGVLVP
jgi:Ca2+-binding RTX toxin-like protein